MPDTTLPHSSKARTAGENAGVTLRNHREIRKSPPRSGRVAKAGSTRAAHPPMKDAALLWTLGVGQVPRQVLSVGLVGRVNQDKAWTRLRVTLPADIHKPALSSPLKIPGDGLRSPGQFVRCTLVISGAGALQHPS